MEETRTTAINIPFPEVGEHHLTISVGACRLKIQPGYGGDWVNGTYEGPPEALPVSVSSERGKVTIAQQREAWAVSGNKGREVPSFDLTLGMRHPYALTLETGASANDLELGGLPINQMAVKHGAGKLVANFTAPNPQAMTTLELTSGAGAMWVRNLANANFGEMTVKGGAASYLFDFGGTLKRDAQVRIETGVAGVEVIVPATTAAKITAAASMSGVEVGDGFTKKEGAFWTEAAVKGQTPVLTIEANISLGGLTIRAV